MLIKSKMQQVIRMLPFYLRVEFSLLIIIFVGTFLEGLFIYQLHDRSAALMQKKLEIRNGINKIEKDSRKLSFSQKQKMILMQDYRAYQKINNLTLQNAIAKIYKIAKKNNFIIQTLQPVIQQKGNDSEECFLNIEATSNYTNLIGFLHALLTGSATLPLLTKTLNLEKSNQATAVISAQNLTSKITFVFYKNIAQPLTYLDAILSKTNSQNTVSIASKDESQIKSTGKNCLRDPFSSDDLKNHYPLGLDFWPVARLNLVGIVQQEKRGLAIVADPNDDIYKVVAGDKIGREQRIIAVLGQGEIILEKEKNQASSNSTDNRIHLTN